ncbi:16S rRNA (uracil1498-N3)-methyltransferase [Humitalea rosea]|uniref:Ribosomal RNA small subunit methyltransferase E n=1 Tax=Humitalea rosea TaxID=990373 RepID=A0A2W7I6S9_9PROT|nr:16S rRNA (uracil(1498)-N(3))-methyltransferase [Humitalea rosea]PZW41878.1 16S rRNA (uracil1498-N3)-methyltransferase [Humitalea rosea]
MSTIQRLHLDQPLAEGLDIAGDAAAARYLGAVLRKSLGDSLLLFNARDGEYAATISALRKEHIRFAVGAQTRAPTPAGDVRLLLAALKRDAMEWAVEKATELGIARLQPVFTQRCVVTSLNLDRLRSIAREAAEQSERIDIPEILPPAPLHRVLDAWDGSPILVAAERRDAPDLATALAGRGLPLGVLVGPEGGFTGPELDDLMRRPFVVPATLGPRILRAETAVVAALAVMQALVGDTRGGR